MYDEKSIAIDRTLFLIDILLTILIFVGAFFVRNFFPLDGGQVDLSSHLFLVPLLLALVVGFLQYFGGYDGPRQSSLLKYTWAVFRAVALAIGMILTLLFFFNIQYVSRVVILIFAIGDFVGLSVVRALLVRYFHESIKSGRDHLCILIIGTGVRARELMGALREKSEWGIKIVGCLDPDPRYVGEQVEGIQVLGTVVNISQCLKQHVIDEVIVAIPRSLLRDAEPIALACEEEGIKLRFMADLFSVQMARVSLAQVGSIPLLTMEPVAQDQSRLFAKRVFDVVLTSLAMPLALPVMALVALAIKLDSPGPVFFVQKRVGLRKHLFPLYKFRSMVVDAEEKLKEIEHLNEAEGPIFKMKNDPRITRVGRFIRKTSLDELPQLFNVLKGDMSLVGPRPMSQRDVALFDSGIQRKRFSVKPGITCIWQISGRSNLPFDKWLELDLEYIENWSLWLDFKILFKTVPAVLFSKGAV